MTKSKIHNVWFYKPKPEAIYSMALHAEDKKLAVARANANIEIWNLLSAPFIERTITCCSENLSIESIGWSGNRLFSCGLQGLLVEYDLSKLCIKNKAVVTGEAAFCLAIHSKNGQIAVGTEQGYINLFSIKNDEMSYEKFIDKQEGRVICLAYDHSGEYIASGSMDAVRIWSVKTGHALHKMSTGRAESKQPTIVWCITITQDLTIISGDSRGKLTFWDGTVGAQLESYQSHKADILSLCLSNDETSLYCAGIDPNIVNYVRIQVKGGTYRWVKNIQRKVHDHDVRALVLFDNKLYSGGTDGYLACSYHPPKTLLKYPPILQNTCVSLSPIARLILLKYPTCIEIWSLGTSDESTNTEKTHLGLKIEPKKLAFICKSRKEESGRQEREGFSCCALSADGKFLVYSTQQKLKLYGFNYDGLSKPNIIPIEFLKDGQAGPCINALFLPNNNLIVAPNTGGLRIIAIKNNHCNIVQDISKTELEDTITHLIISSCGKYIVAADPKSNICIWLLKNKQYNYYCKLPKYQIPPTALAIHPTTLNLVVVYSNSNIIEYDLKSRQLTQFSRNLAHSLPKQWFSRNYVIRNITFDPRAKDIIILHDDNTVIVIDKQQKGTDSASKIRKLDFTSLAIEENDKKQNLITHIKKYKHLVYFGALVNDEMVAVEVNPLTLIEQLPPCLFQNTFGRK